MSNIRSLSDLKKNEGGNGGGRGGGFPNGGPPPGFPGFPGLPGSNGPSTQKVPESKNIKYLQDGQLESELAKASGKLVVVYYTAQWCGPCKMIGPVFSELADKYVNVVFLKVDVDQCQGTADANNISAIPAFHFYKNNSKVTQFEGADANKLREMVEKFKTTGGFGSGGYVLSTGQVIGEVLSSKPEDSSSQKPLSGYTLGGPSSHQPLGGHPLAFGKPLGIPSDNPNIPSSQPDKPNSSSSDVNEIFLVQLMEMGFSKEKCEQALKATGNSSVQVALDWCFSHPDEEEGTKLGGSAPFKPSSNEQSSTTSSTPPSDPMEVESTGTRNPEQSTKKEGELVEHNAICNICEQKIFGIRWKCSNCSDYDMCSTCYETKNTHNSQHTFEAFTEDIQNVEKKPLTPEELAERKQKLQEKIKRIRHQKAEEEIQRDLEREKSRRKSGKEALEAQKLWKEKQQEREALLRKKEKEEEAKAKARIKQKLEQDKRERLAQKEQAQKEKAQNASEETASQPPEKKEYTKAVIQIRFPDGTTINASFKPTDHVRAVYEHIYMLTQKENFSLMTTFPRKIYSKQNGNLDSVTLQEADMVPNGIFIVQN